MNIYISGTPEVKSELILEVINFLNLIKGPINFKFLAPLPKKNSCFKVNELETGKNSYSILTELKKVAGALRKSNIKIEKIDLVVVLTSVKLNFIEFNSPKKWFSHYDENDIYIRTYNWSSYTSNRPFLAIAHQVIENTFHILNGNKSNQFDYYHETPEGGCINAFCLNELDIEYKINTGKICKDCQLRLKDNNVLSGFIEHLKGLLAKISSEANSLDSEIFKSNDKKVYVDSLGEIFLDGYKLSMKEKPKAFYLFFIINNNRSFTLEDLKNLKEIIILIYSQIKLNASEGVIYNSLGYEYINNHKSDEIIIQKNTSITESELKTNLRKIRDDIKKAIIKVPTISTSKAYEVKNILIKHQKPTNIFSHNPSLVSIDNNFLNKIKRTSS